MGAYMVGLGREYGREAGELEVLGAGGAVNEGRGVCNLC